MKRFKDFFYENVIIPDISEFIKHLMKFGNDYITKNQMFSNKQLLNLLNSSIESDKIQFKQDGEQQIKIFGGDRIGISSLYKDIDNDLIYIEIVPSFFNNLRDTTKFYNLIKFIKQHIGHEFIHRKQDINNALDPDNPKYFEQEHEVEAFAYNAANELKNSIKDKKEILNLINTDFINKKLLEGSYRYSLYIDKFIDNKNVLNKFLDNVKEYIQLLP